MAEINQCWSVVAGMGQWCSAVGARVEQGRQCGLFGRTRPRHVVLVISASERGRATLSPLASSARRAARLCERQGGQGERAEEKKAPARAWRRSGCGCGPPARRARSPAWSRGRRRRRRGLFLEPAVAPRPMSSCTAVPRRQQHRVRRSLLTGQHPTERGGAELAAASA